VRTAQYPLESLGVGSVKLIISFHLCRLMIYLGKNELFQGKNLHKVLSLWCYCSELHMPRSTRACSKLWPSFWSLEHVWNYFRFPAKILA